MHPADADFLYFVSRNDGSHEFARTLEEHNRNVQKFQVQYFRDRVSITSAIALVAADDPRSLPGHGFSRALTHA